MHKASLRVTTYPLSLRSAWRLSSNLALSVFWPDTAERRSFASWEYADRIKTPQAPSTTHQGPAGHVRFSAQKTSALGEQRNLDVDVDPAEEEDRTEEDEDEQDYAENEDEAERDDVDESEEEQGKDVEETGWRNPHRFRNSKGNLHGVSLGLVSLPDELRRRIAALFRGYPRLTLKRDATGLSSSLRARTQLKVGEVRRLEDDIPGVIGYKKHLAYAYCAHRLPGVFGCTFRVLNELRLRRPQWSPKSLLDYGSGPGTAIWSATQAWPDLQDVLAVEPSEGMLEVAKTLLEGFRQVQWKRLIPPDEQPRDLVMASYVLTELKDEEERIAKVRQLWNQTKEGGVLVIVEPGTPIGFHVVRMARRLLLSMPAELGKASMLAPCPHNFKCPMTDDSWCHFAQRVQRIPVQTSVKENVTRNYEEETFSYIVVTKGTQLVDERESFDRIIKPPKKRPRHVILKTCGHDDGDIRHFVVLRSDGVDIYKDARKSKWGDGFAFGSESKEHFMRNLESRKRKGTFRYSDLSKPTAKSKAQRKTEAEQMIRQAAQKRIKKRGSKKKAKKH